MNLYHVFAEWIEKMNLTHPNCIQKVFTVEDMVAFARYAVNKQKS